MSNSGNIWVTILPLVILIVVMYLLLIRPQKKREKEITAMRSSVQVGDEIITIGGICGKVVKTKEDSLVIQVGADRVKFEIMRWSVSKIVEEGINHGKADDEDEAEVRKSKPKRMKAAQVEEPETVEEATEEDVVEAEVVEEAEVETAEEKEEK